MKILALILALLTVLAFVGCSDNSKKANKSDQTTVNDETTSSDHEQSESETTSDTNPVSAPVELYKIEMVTDLVDAERYSATLSYPAVSGYSSNEIEEKVNALVKSYTYEKMNYAIAQTGAYTDVYYSVDMLDVTYMNEGFFSVITKVSVTIDGEPDSTKLAYGLNVDLKNSRIVEFGSFIKFNEFKTNFGNGYFGLISGYKNLLEETTYDDIINPYSELYMIYPEYYIRKNGDTPVLGIIAETVPVLDYYATFECNITDNSMVSDSFFELVND